MKSLNAIHFWGQEVDIGAAAGDHGGIPSHQVERNFLHQLADNFSFVRSCVSRQSST